MARDKGKAKTKRKENDVDEAMEKIVNGVKVEEIAGLTAEYINQIDKKDEKEEMKENKNIAAQKPMPDRAIKTIVTDKLLKNEKVPLRLWIYKHRPTPVILVKLVEYLGKPSYDKTYDAEFLTDIYNELADKIRKV